jgi:hypothetical protein
VGLRREKKKREKNNFEGDSSTNLNLPKEMKIYPTISIITLVADVRTP